MNERPFCVGLTGGIGSGKSAVAAMLAQRGAGVIDTDAIAHAITAAGGAAIPAIAAAFGEEYLNPQGALDRAKMRVRVFADEQARRQLEAILHPMIRERVDAELQRLAPLHPFLVLVVPLLIETGAYRDQIDRVLVVDCPEALQIARVQARSGLAEEQVRAILAAQASRVQRLAAADDVIANTGTLAELETAVDALFQHYLRLAQAEGDRR